LDEAESIATECGLAGVLVQVTAVRG
jgi:hypothetical protein